MGKMIEVLKDGELNKLSAEDKAFMEGFCAAIDSAASLTYNLDVYKDDFDIDGVDINLARFLENHEEVRRTLEESLAHWLETERIEFLTSMIEEKE